MGDVCPLPSGPVRRWEYAVTLRHDAGRVTRRAVAVSWCEAARLVTTAEGAPDRSVVGIKRVREVTS